MDGSIGRNGPTIDGRRKPDVMAPSTNQVAPGYSEGDPNYWYTTPNNGATSWAVPHTAGVAALLLEYANQTAEPADSHNVVIKAVIVNSTFPDIGSKNGNPTDPTVWHYQRGYGRIDALRALNTLAGGKISTSALVTAQTGWAYNTIGSNQTHEYQFAGRKNKRFILTVTWNCLIDKSGSTYDVNLPKFNLDVTVKNPSGGTVFSETNNVDNLEKIDLLLPADGNYTVSLNNPTSKSRAYSLAFEFLLAGDFNRDYIADEKDLYQIAFEWLTAGPYTDIIADDRVNNLDFTAFADNWLKIDTRYYNP